MSAKLSAIHAFLARWSHLAKQGSIGWSTKRNTTIGGSELDMLIHSEHQLVAQKIGLKRVPEMLAMLWGSVMEDTVRTIISLLFGCAIEEAGSVPSAEVDGKTFSMDGLGVVNFLGESGEREAMITLFEFKSMWTRQMRQGEVFPKYVPQVKSGMSDLGLPEIALYVEWEPRISEFVFLEQGNTQVETWLHTKDKCTTRPMAWGFIGFYATDAADLPDGYDARLFQEWTRHGNMDFAVLDRSNLLCALFKMVRTGHVHLWQSDVGFDAAEFSRCNFLSAQRISAYDRRVDMNTEYARFHAEARENRWFPLGVLGTKMMQLNIVPVAKEEGYTKKYESKIIGAVAKIKTLQAIEDPTERYLAYCKMYEITPETTSTEVDQVADALASM